MSKRTIFAVIGALILLIASWSCHHRSSTSKQQTGNFGGGGRRGSMSTGGPVPVVAGKVEQKDMPIYLDGLGTVQAFNPHSVQYAGNLSLARPAQAAPKAQTASGLPG